MRVAVATALAVALLVGSGDAGMADNTRELALDTTVWWGRFELRLDDATFAPSGFGPSGTLTIATSFTNRTPDRAKLDAAEVGLEIGGKRYPPGLGRLPEVPGNGTRGGTLGFWLPEDFDPSRARLVFGTGDQNQSIVPLDAPQDAVTFAPSAVDVHATGRTPDVRLTLTGGTLAGSFRTGERGMGLLQLSFDTLFSGSDVLGKLIDSTDFQIATPTGAVVTGKAIASADLVMEVIPPRGEIANALVTFVVPAPLDPGKYTVTYTDQLTLATATLVFTPP